MKCKVIINEIKTINYIEGAWTSQDYIALLDAFNFPDAEGSSNDELLELLYLAINDFEPDEAAEIILQYKLSDQLSEGQIKNLAHEMIEDNVAEEYSDIALHHQLFDINQLLHKAYNGTFPNAKASKINFELTFLSQDTAEIDKELVLKALNYGLSDRNLIKRLFEEQLTGKVEFSEAEHIIWQLKSLGNHVFSLITSDYWLNKEDFLTDEFDGVIHEFEEEED